MTAQKIIKTIQYLTCALIVFVPLVYFPTGIFPFQVIKTVIFQSLVEIIFALWLGLAIFNKEYRPKLTPITIALFVFMAIISLSVVFGSDWRAGLWSDESRTLGLVALWHFFALFIILSSLGEKINPFDEINTESNRSINWKKLFFLSFGTSVLVSLIGISQKFFVLPKGSNAWLYILYSGIPERVGSTFSNSSFLAGYLLFNFFIGLWLMIQPIANRQSSIVKDIKFWLLAIGTILILVAIFFSQTIGVISALIIGIFILLIYFSVKKEPLFINRLNFRKIAIGLLILSIVFCATFWFTRSASLWQKIPGLSRIAQASFETKSIRDRLITWQISLRAFKEKPLLGWGFENFRIPFNKYYDPRILTQTMHGTYWDKPHNILLEYLTNTGVLGLLAYLGIFAAAFYSIFKKPRINTDEKLINADKKSASISLNQHKSVFIAAAIIAYFIQNFFVFDTIGTYLMFFLMLAFIDSQFGKPLINADNKLISADKKIGINQPKSAQISVYVFLLLSLIPIYYNYQIFNASRWEYWGVNYFLNRLPESSLVSFSRAINTPTPYIDDIRKNFANTVAQAYQQRIEYPRLPELQEKLVEYLRLVIERHPKDFFNYITLAEFENVFYKYNPDSYLKEADELAQKAFELSPQRQQTYYVLAKTKLLKGDARAAYQIFEETIKINPNFADSHFYFGLMAYGLGDAEKGAEEIALAKSLGRGPQKAEEFIALGNFVGDFDHNYKKAIELYKLAIPHADKTVFPEILLKLAVAYYFDGDLEQSRQTFSELKGLIDLRELPIYSDLKPVLQELNISY